jgi:serine O-acetyltransferase
MTSRRERPLVRAVQQRHPKFKEAVLADLAVERRGRGEHNTLGSRAATLFELVRVFFVSDAFGALVLYRFKASCQRRGIPVVPRIAHRAAMLWSQLMIGDVVVVHPGVRLMHGHIVIDGFVEIHPGVQIRPFVTIGRRGSAIGGPTICRGASIGTGAKILGPITVGEGARVGANAVVIEDVPAAAVVVGVPARRVTPPNVRGHPPEGR